eukprot:g14189.t1
MREESMPSQLATGYDRSLHLNFRDQLLEDKRLDEVWDRFRPREMSAPLPKSLHCNLPALLKEISHEGQDKKNNFLPGQAGLSRKQREVGQVDEAPTLVFTTTQPPVSNMARSGGEASWTQSLPLIVGIAALTVAGYNRMTGKEKVKKTAKSTTPESKSPTKRPQHSPYAAPSPAAAASPDSQTESSLFESCMSPEEEEAWRDGLGHLGVLFGTPVGNFLPDEGKRPDVISLMWNDTQKEALRLMREHDVRALPVLNLKGQGQDAYKGIVNCRDILICVMRHELVRSLEEDLTCLTEREVQDLEGDVPFDALVISALGQSLESQTMEKIAPDAPLYALIRSFSINGQHRALVDFQQSFTHAARDQKGPLCSPPMPRGPSPGPRERSPTSSPDPDNPPGVAQDRGVSPVNSNRSSSPSTPSKEAFELHVTPSEAARPPTIAGLENIASSPPLGRRLSDVSVSSMGQHSLRSFVLAHQARRASSSPSSRRGLQSLPTPASADTASSPHKASLCFFSQTDVLRLLKSKARELGPVLRRPVEQIATADPITLSQADSALTCFQKLIIDEVSAAPIVDRKGSLVGTLSVSDVRALTHVKLNDLLLPIGRFMKNLGLLKEQATCSSSDTMNDVIDLLLRRRVHRAWVTVENPRCKTGRLPVGVVSMTDIINAMYKSANELFSQTDSDIRFQAGLNSVYQHPIDSSLMPRNMSDVSDRPNFGMSSSDDSDHSADQPAEQ